MMRRWEISQGRTTSTWCAQKAHSRKGGIIIALLLYWRIINIVSSWSPMHGSSKRCNRSPGMRWSVLRSLAVLMAEFGGYVRRKNWLLGQIVK